VSKKPAVPPPELAQWQLDVIERVARSKLEPEVVLGRGVALSVVHLHHRRSDDVDFFLQREVDAVDLRPIVQGIKRTGARVDQRRLGPRLALVLSKDEEEFGRVDFSYYPYESIDPPTRWRGVRVESLLDMTVNKLQAVLTRFQPRDFVDLYFLLKEGPEQDLDRLLDLVRAKFDVGAHRLGLAERLLLAREISILPTMLRPVEPVELVAFFEERARGLARPR
jgi:hypothetical protein